MISAQTDVTAVWLDDVPVSPTAIYLYDEMGAAVQVDDYTTHTVTLVDPLGETVATLSHTIHAHHLEVTWPTVSPFILSGVYTLAIVLEVDDAYVTVEPWEIVAQSDDGWLTLEMTRARWSDAPTSDAYLWTFLQAARSQCETYAPPLAIGATVPERYRQAQLMQARALFMSFISNQNDSVGIEGYQVRTFPLDWNIKALLRPKTGKPLVA